MRASNLDIYRGANPLVKQHGELAPLRPVERPYELLDAGRPDGCARGNHLGALGSEYRRNTV